MKHLAVKHFESTPNSDQVPLLEIAGLKNKVETGDETEDELNFVPSPPDFKLNPPSSPPKVDIFDEILIKVQTAHTSSEFKYIENQAKNKHYVRANLEIVQREAVKVPLDLNFIRRASYVEKMWILATYLQSNTDIEYQNICKNAGIDEEKLKEFLQYGVTCKEAMGLFPRCYLQLKDEFKKLGSNIEISNELSEFAKDRPEFEEALEVWKTMRPC